MRALVLGTSNCVLGGGVKDALVEAFGLENVDNLSIGASSGTHVALFRMIEGIEFEKYDYVFFDSIVNECWQLLSGRTPDSLWRIARVFYSMLPAGVTYVYLGFAIKHQFYHPGIVEDIHKSLCREFGINFVSFREVLLTYEAKKDVSIDQIFQKDDTAHYDVRVANFLMKQLFELLPRLPAKTQPPLLSVENFFLDSPLEFADEVQTYETSWRTQTFGLFKEGTRIPLRSGLFLGFDHCELNSQAYLWIYGDRFLQKSLFYPSTVPWMKFVAFARPLITYSTSYMVPSAVKDEAYDAEFTDAINDPGVPFNGEVRLANLFYAKASLEEIIALNGIAERQSFVPFVSVEEELTERLLNDAHIYDALAQK